MEKFKSNLLRFLLWLLIIFIFLFVIGLSSCVTNKIDPTVSYTPVYKESKGMKHTFLLDRKGLIWVMNFTKHCLPILPDVEVTFTKEVPYKRFVNRTYLIEEMRGYNCDGDFAVLLPQGGMLEGLLRTHYIRSIKVKTLGGGIVIVPTTKNSKRIFDDIAKLDWKTPIPNIDDVDTNGNVN